MFRKIQEARENEEGFTLIELLVVVIIIGILAAIAIPTFLNQRTTARESAVESTLRSAANYMEIVYTDSNAYPSAVGALETEGFNQGDVTVTVTSSNASGYCLDGVHSADATVTRYFDSADGTPADGTCSSAGVAYI